MNDKLKIIFISRAFPPVVGGIENQNYALSVWLPKYAEVKPIINKQGRIFLPLFAPYALLKALFLFRKYDAVVLGDGVISIIGWFLKLIYKKPVIAVVHGLDINWDSSSLNVPLERFLVKLYQKLWVDVFIHRIDKLIAVGNTTIKEGMKKGIPKEKFVFVPNGVDPDIFFEHHSREELEKLLGINLSDKKVVLTLGRLAKRKGVAWFIRNVMPLLQEKIIYVIAGKGVDQENIADAIREKNLENRIIHLTDVSDATKKLLYNTADLFVQPNIKVVGDMEGFGMVVLEAASCERVVLASEIEGLKDAIVNGKNGFLAESENAPQYAKKIEALMLDNEGRKKMGQNARKYIIENLTWDKIAKKYIDEIQKVVNKK